MTVNEEFFFMLTVLLSNSFGLNGVFTGCVPPIGHIWDFLSITWFSQDLYTEFQGKPFYTLFCPPFISLSHGSTIWLLKLSFFASVFFLPPQQGFPSFSPSLLKGQGRCTSSHLSRLIKANGRWWQRIILLATGLVHSLHSDLVLDFTLTLGQE